MYAILETGGKQIKAIAGRHIDIEKLPQTKGEKISLKNILMLVSGKDSKIGNPYIKGAAINGHVVDQFKDDKVIVYKMRPKKGTRKKYGHRQHYSRVFIESIELDGKVISKAENAPRVKKQKAKEEEQAPKLDSTTEKASKKKVTKKKEE